MITGPWLVAKLTHQVLADSWPTPRSKEQPASEADLAPNAATVSDDGAKPNYCYRPLSAAVRD